MSLKPVPSNLGPSPPSLLPAPGTDDAVPSASAALASPPDRSWPAQQTDPRVHVRPSIENDASKIPVPRNIEIRNVPEALIVDLDNPLRGGDGPALGIMAGRPPIEFEGLR